MPSKWVPNAAATAPDSHAVYLVFCPANSQLYRFTVKPAATERRYCMHARLRAALIDYLIATWQTAGDRVIDGPRPEDGTDFSSYAAGASPDIPWYDCRGVVVAGHADHAGARADRPQPKTRLRVLRAA